MPTTLRDLLATPRLALALVADAPGASRLDAPITWAHSSDLADPTPWLEPGQLLLTDGTQFARAPEAHETDAYVGRLARAGVVALGFATDVAHETIPTALVASCANAGFPLLEVGGRTPFIAIARHIADRAAAEQRERLEWSQAAQRALARAALRPDGLGAILRELEQRLDTWVQLTDASGAPVEAATTREIPATLEHDVASAARAALRRGRPFGGRVQLGDAGATLQTVGRGGHLLGALVVGTNAPLDAAGNDLVSSVIGLASIALEQGRALEDARLQVRAGVFELLLHGNLEAAERTAARLWGRLPAAPVRVGVVAADTGSRPLVEELERAAERRPERCFFAERDDRLVLVVSSGHVDDVEALLAAHEVCAGFSAPVDWHDVPRGLVEATRAQRHCAAAGTSVRFEALADAGMLGLLASAGAEPMAARVLDPVRSSTNPDHASLLASASVWLEHNGSWDPAARELGIHRHTLRARIRTLEGLLGLDLERFADRAELWAALQFAGEAP